MQPKCKLKGFPNDKETRALNKANIKLKAVCGTFFLDYFLCGYSNHFLYDF